MLRFFSSNSPVNYLFSLIGLLLFLLISIFISIDFLDSVGLNLLVFCSTLVFFYLSNRLFNVFEIVERESYLFAFLFVINAFSWATLNYYNPLVIATSIVAFAIYRIFAAYNKTPNLNYWFDTSFLIGVAALINLYYSFYILALIGSVSIFSQFKLKQFFIVLIGFLLPFFLYFSFNFGFNTSLSLEDTFIQSIVGVDLFEVDIQHNTLQQLNFIYVIFMSIVGMLFYINKISKGTIRERKRMYVFLLFALISILIYIFSYSQYHNVFTIVLLLPFIVFQYYLFSSITKTWLKEVVFIGFAVIQIINIYLNYFS